MHTEPIEILSAVPIRMRHGLPDFLDDLSLVRHGVLDLGSFRSGWTKQLNPVEVRTSRLVDNSIDVPQALLVTDAGLFSRPVLVDGVLRDAAYGMRRRLLREVRRQHNLQIDLGKNQVQRIQSFGDVGTSLNALSATGTATAPTATTWTGAAASFPTATAASGNVGVQGHGVFVANALSASAFTNPVFGVILSNTATVLTVDQWYAVPITGAAGTTPSANSAAFVLPAGTYAAWIALSTSTATPAASDVTRTADGLWGDGTTGGTATEQTTQGLNRAYCGQGSTTAPTLPATKQYQFQHTWTYTGSTNLTLAKVVLFNSAAGAGSMPLLETLLGAAATVTANGDTLQVTWTITC